jgi:hypothetical protein
MITPAKNTTVYMITCQAIARERDWLQLEVNRLTDELHLAHEALKREFVHKGIIKAVNP